MSGVLLLLLFLRAQSADDLVAAYERSRQPFDHVEFRLRFRETYRGPSPLNGQVAREGTFHVRHQDVRWWINSQGYARYPDGSGQLRQQTERAGGQGTTYVDAGRDDNGAVQVMAAFGETPDLQVNFQFCDTFTVVMGYFRWLGPHTLTSILKDSTLKVSERKLEATGAYGTVEVWFDERLRPFRIKHVAQGDDVINGHKVSSLPPVANDDWRPNGSQARFEQVFEVSKFTESYPIEFATTVSEYSASGQVAEWRYEGSIDELKQAPDFGESDFAMTIIPDGTYVQVMDSPNIEYEWRDGEIAKVISASAESKLASARFRSRFSAATYFVVFGILLITATLIGSWLYRRATE